jgi:hypothetical protein
LQVLDDLADVCLGDDGGLEPAARLGSWASNGSAARALRKDNCAAAGVPYTQLT